MSIMQDVHIFEICNLDARPAGDPFEARHNLPFIAQAILAQAHVTSSSLRFALVLFFA